MDYTTKFESKLGVITLASDGENLTGLWLEGQKYHGDGPQKDSLPIFDAAKSWLKRYFDGQRPMISELNLAPDGSAFRKEVWNILCAIPYGEVVTYRDIAKQMAAKMNKEKMSSQAVGGAVGHNPISIIIPCHRVVGADGSLTGYAGGVHLKAKLLEHEGADMSSLFFPKR